MSEQIEDPTATAVTNIAGDVKELIAQPAIGHLIHDIPAVVKETKAGYKTTEFWVAAATVLLTQLGALHLPGHYGATIATVAAVLGYIVSRGVAKAGVPNVVPDPVVVAPVEEIVQREEGAAA